MQNISFTAPGKVILFGEHAVVYGYPAIALATNQRLCITLNIHQQQQSFFSDICKYISQYSIETLIKKIQEFGSDMISITIKSNIPLGCGMGSSAACAVALSASVRAASGLIFSKKKINTMAYTIEKHAHTTPSGIDNTVSCYGGMIKFQRQNVDTEMYRCKTQTLSDFWIVCTGMPKESTREMVALVRKKQTQHKKEFEKYFYRVGEIVEHFFHQKQNWNKKEIASLIRENEWILEKIGVVSQSTAYFIREIEKLGGAAKVSGAGGCLFASGIVLVYHPDTEKLCQFMKNSIYSYFPLLPTNIGVEAYEKS